MLGEITHLQAIVDDLTVLTEDPHKLPPASEQVTEVYTTNSTNASGDGQVIWITNKSTLCNFSLRLSNKSGDIIYFYYYPQKVQVFSVYSKPDIKNCCPQNNNGSSAVNTQYSIHW